MIVISFHIQYLDKSSFDSQKGVIATDFELQNALLALNWRNKNGISIWVEEGDYTE